MKHIASHLHTIVRLYNENAELLETICERLDFRDIKIEQEEIKPLLQTPTDRLPKIFSNNESITYASIPTPGKLYLIGPIRLDPPVYLKNKLPELQVDINWLNTLSTCEIQILIQDILLIYNLFHYKELGANDIINHNCFDPLIELEVQKIFSNILFNNNEMGKRHNPYDQEVREFSSIRNGDLEQLKISMAEDYVGTIGTLANNKLRHMKNLGIVLVTLASRAAMEGGILPEIAYSLSDSYICKIEELSDIVSIEHLAKQAEYQYAKMVHDLKEQVVTGSGKIEKNPVVNKCKDYVFKHIHEKIRIDDMAKELKMNGNYLSEVFKKHEGVTINNFIIREKINLAKNMLIYSSYSYIEIATYLGFSSQSHFGKHFKNITGFTPKQHRDNYGVNEFL
jgi:AraC-like DNA-binding protein